MLNIVSKLEDCRESRSLRVRHDALAVVLEELLGCLQKEVGEIGQGDMREIIAAQEHASNELTETTRPFRQHGAENDNALEILLAKQESESGFEYVISLMAFPGQAFDFCGWSNGIEAIPREVLDLTKDQVADAAARLESALLILSKVYEEPDSTICQAARQLDKSM